MNRAGILNLASRASRKSVKPFLGQPVAAVDDGDGDFAEPLVGRGEHADLADVGAGVAGRLDLGRRNVLAAADDDVLLAVDDEQIAVLVEIADVAGAHEAVAR